MIKALINVDEWVPFKPHPSLHPDGIQCQYSLERCRNDATWWNTFKVYENDHSNTGHGRQRKHDSFLCDVHKETV